MHSLCPYIFSYETRFLILIPPDCFVCLSHTKLRGHVDSKHRKKPRNYKFYEKCIIDDNMEQGPTVDVVPCSGTILFVLPKKQDYHDFYLPLHTTLLLLYKMFGTWCLGLSQDRLSSHVNYYTVTGSMRRSLGVYYLCETVTNIAKNTTKSDKSSYLYFTFLCRQ